MVGVMHGFWNFFEINFDRLHFSKHIDQCVTITSPEDFWKRPRSFYFIAFQSFSFFVGVTGTIPSDHRNWVQHFKILALAKYYIWLVQNFIVGSMYMEISETNIIFYPDRNITYVITDGKCYNGSKKLKKA